MNQDTSLLPPDAIHDAEKSKNVLDQLDDTELTRLFVIVGQAVATRRGNPYKRDTANFTAFSAMFPSNVQPEKIPYFKQLDTDHFESWDTEELRSWLFKY